MISDVSIRFIFTVISISADVVEDGVSTTIALDSTIVASYERYLCS